MQLEFLDVRQLEALQAVVDSGSITKAAEHIGKSQSAVTRLIQELEVELGFAVLKRNGPRVQPTENGLSLYREATHFLTGLQAVTSYARSVAKCTGNGLSIGAISAVATSIVPDALADVVALKPDIPINVLVDNSEMVTKAVVDQRVDIGIIGFAPETPGIEFHWIAEVPFVALVRRDDPLAERSVISHSDFDGRHLITASGRYRLRLMFERALDEKDISPQSIIVANASHVSTSLASMPNAIALVQSSAASAFGQDDLIAIPLDFYLPFHFGVITAIGLPMNPYNEAMIAALEQRASELPGYRKCAAFPGFGQPI